MKLDQILPKYGSLVCAGSLLLPSVALAANSEYEKGDLVLYFQQEGGANTIYANIGNAALVFRGSASGPGATNLVNFLNINAALVSAFGAGWAGDPTVYAGVAGVFATSSLSNTVTNGDPARTVYVSSRRNSVGTVGQPSSTAWSVGGTTGMSTASNSMDSMNNVLENSYTTAVAVSPASVSLIDNANQNPFLAPAIQGNGFQTFPGGVQQAGSTGSFGSFGSAGTVEFALDLYRILAKTGLVGQVSGTQYDGTFEGTITVNSSGQVSFISQGTATPYETWIGGFNPPLTNASDRLPAADPDNDGFSNLTEFVLNGNPGVSSQSISPVLNASGSNFVFSFNRRDDSEAGNTVVFQYGSDLAGWTNATIGATGGTVGNATIAITENTNNPDAIMVTVPKSVAIGGKLFGRLRITNP